MMEEWCDIFGYEGLYRVSTLGNVKALDMKLPFGYMNRTKESHLLKPTEKSNGYLQVDLHKEGKRKKFYVHRLVAETFIPNPEHKPEVNHKDHDKKNNTVSNLQWCTRSENAKYSYDMGIIKHPSKKLTEYEVFELRRRYAGGMTQVQLSTLFSISRMQVSRIVRHENWK